LSKIARDSRQAEFHPYSCITKINAPGFRAVREASTVRVDINVILIIFWRIDGYENLTRKFRNLAGTLQVGSIVTAGSLAACTAACAPGPVVRTGTETAAISSTVTEPAGYETIYLSGMTEPCGLRTVLARHAAGPDSGDTEAQQTRCARQHQECLGVQGAGLGDIE